MRLVAALCILIGLLGLCASGVAAAAEEISYSLGVGYRRSAPGAIADRYLGAAAFQAGLEVRRGSASLAFEGGIQRSSSTLDAPFFLEGAEGTLTVVPLDLVARHEFGGSRLWSPYAGAGFELLWLSESFRYRLDGEDRESRPDGGFHPGGLLVVGMNRNRFPHVRFEGFLSYVPIHRMRSSLDSTYEDPEASRLNAGGYGVRLCWRLP